MVLIKKVSSYNENEVINCMNLNFKVKCIENKCGNTQFVVGREYTVIPNGIKSEWVQISFDNKEEWLAIEKADKQFEFAFCKFEKCE